MRPGGYIGIILEKSLCHKSHLLEVGISGSILVGPYLGGLVIIHLEVPVVGVVCAGACIKAAGEGVVVFYADIYALVDHPADIHVLLHIGANN